MGRAQPSASVTIAGALLVLLGAVAILGGLVSVAVGALASDPQSQLDLGTSALSPTALGRLVLAIGIGVTIYGLLEIVAAVGVFARRAWGRLLGIVVAALGLVLGLLAFAGQVSDPTATDGLAVALVLLASYAFAFLALVVGGHAFRGAAQGS